MSAASDVFLHACACRTALGNTRESWQALVDGQVALRPTQPLPEAEERVPLALTGDLCAYAPPRWLEPSIELLQTAPDLPWGDPRHPVVITSSNFGIDQMLAFHQGKDDACRHRATAVSAAGAIAERLGWGPNRAIISNACVSAQLGMIHAERLLANDLADQVLVFSFDYLSHFVVGGFLSLKILNNDFPQPYADRESGSIALGDGAGYVVLSREPSAFRLAASSSHSEFHHMTGNDPSGAGFEAVFQPLAAATSENVWVKGHGTGTLEAGRLESAAALAAFPNAPLVSWKGSLGHTLGSCGIVELAIAVESFHANCAPGTVGSSGPLVSPNAQAAPFALDDFGGVVLISSAFGGAHIGHLLIRE